MLMLFLFCCIIMSAVVWLRKWIKRLKLNCKLQIDDDDDDDEENYICNYTLYSNIQKWLLLLSSLSSPHWQLARWFIEMSTWPHS